MIRKVTENEKICQPGMAYRIDLVYYHYYISEEQFRVLAKEVEILNGEIRESDKICRNKNCLYCTFELKCSMPNLKCDRQI